MNSYDEDKKKNKKLTFQDGKNTLENSTDQNSDYGSISNEIDSILNGSSQHSNSDTKEKETNNQNKDVNVTIDTPLKKKEQEQLIHQSPPTINQKDNIKIEEELFEIASKTENKESGKFPKIEWKKKEQLVPEDTEFKINSNNKENKRDIFKIEQNLPGNTPTQKKQETDFIKQEIKQNIPNSKKSALNLFSKNKKQKNNTKVQSDNSQKSPPLENIVEKPLSENDPTYQPMDNNNQTIDNDIHRLLTITDDLLGKLPEDVITEFASTEDFELYKQVMNKIENDPTYQPMDNDNQTINNDIHRLLTITDDLLGKLPEDVITEFASTEDFELYKQVMNKYQIGK